ncbi:MAG: type I 3-dehydroquinate dehydratase [bacterium]|nr:type I 3-dehydroquinate dehydratase [bacterium]
MPNLKIGKVILGRAPVVVGTITDSEVNSGKLKDNIFKKIDIVEIRIDRFKDVSIDYITSVVKKLNASLTNPIIVTIRDKKEGGEKAITDDARFEILKNIVQYIDCVDIEINSKLFKNIPSFFHFKKKIVIASYHNFKNTPSNAALEKILAKGKKSGADIIKIAVMVNSRDDLAQLINFTIKNRKKNIITIAMGDIGRISRILNPILGSLLTYGYVITPSAPGQPPVNEIMDQLKSFDPEYSKN